MSVRLSPLAQFWSVDALMTTLRETHRRVREMERVVVMHPDDVTPQVRERIEATPLLSLRESKYVQHGKAYLLAQSMLEPLP